MEQRTAIGIMKATAFFLVCFALGCAPQTQKWHHPYNDEAQFYADQAECYRFAVQAVNQQQSKSSVQQDVRIYNQEDEDKNVIHLGPSRSAQMGEEMGEAFGKSFERGFYQQMYFNQCMEAKGYYKK